MVQSCSAWDLGISYCYVPVSTKNVWLTHALSKHQKNCDTHTNTTRKAGLLELTKMISTETSRVINIQVSWRLQTWFQTVEWTTPNIADTFPCVQNVASTNRNIWRHGSGMRFLDLILFLYFLPLEYPSYVCLTIGNWKYIHNIVHKISGWKQFFLRMDHTLNELETI